MENETAAPAVRQRCAGKMRACLSHLDRLTRDMLAFAGGGALCAETFAVADLIDGVRQLAAPLMERTGCRLEIIDDGRGACVRGNREALLTALQNLLDNAVAACADAATKNTGHAGGSLRLLVRRVEGREELATLEILLADDGPGIPPAIRARVTEPFFTTKPRGTGLGLAVVHAVVQAHKGAMWIDSEPGMGTTVGIRLPAAATEENP
jgi:two-component system sensor histidine kinase FlrB